MAYAQRLSTSSWTSHFTFKNLPIPAVKFEGTVNCEVLDFEVERRLRFSWVDREEESNGTHLFLEHEGFDPNHPLQLKGYQMMSQGWNRIVGQRLAEVLAEDSKATLPDGI